MPHWFYILYCFVIGSCVGSFLNVVVYRLPRGQSLVRPPSRCPNCEHPLAWYDNIPVFGWLLLAGKCRYCKKPVSIRYPIVEAICGVLFAAMYVAIFIAHQGPFWAAYNDEGRLLILRRMQSIGTDWPIFVLYLFAVAALLAASLMDLDCYLIPPLVPLLMAGAGVLVHALADRPGMSGTLIVPPAQGALAAGGTIGLLLSLGLLRLGYLPLSFAEGESPLEVEKLNGKPEDPPLRDYTPAQVRAEMGKEILFLLPPLALAALAVLLQMQGWPLHRWWMQFSQAPHVGGLLGALLGGLVGGGVVWLTRIFGSVGFGKEAMGLGDVDLMLGVGAIIGPGAAVVSFFVSPVFGLPVALAFFLVKSRRQLPYVPYLSMAAAAVMLFYFPIYDYLRPGVIGLGEILRSIM